ncbi:hypothetical protein BJ508DRAFT_113053 [Ascobolus immersus RN42]|uniref:Uncharacterized protein n=1 Tax=Ascobolus immersus RN42 TaxID=1160509 RepID=A0A3N4H841_ASCIM|nr:hypothetical protein BJ508DRAFT_113053 [Ascobolus immersus RN42]
MEVWGVGIWRRLGIRRPAFEVSTGRGARAVEENGGRFMAVIRFPLEYESSVVVSGWAVSSRRHLAERETVSNGPVPGGLHSWCLRILLFPLRSGTTGSAYPKAQPSPRCLSCASPGVLTSHRAIPTPSRIRPSVLKPQHLPPTGYSPGAFFGP